MDGDRQMFDVNIACAECGSAITQLPFEPSGDRPVFCTNCLRARRNARDNGPRRERQMFNVDVNCADCGTHITQLPFQPTGDRPIYCFDCNKNRRA
ncbi:MAG: zinc-binding protein [Candidatus Magasanikbacteria bacterium]|nr:zinc-binding protein [Candidatus Magasanikbacteria bacterium]